MKQDIDELRSRLAELASAGRSLMRQPFHVRKIEVFARALRKSVNNRAAFGVFLICVFAGFLISIVTSRPPTLAVLAFTLATLVFALALGLESVVELSRREIAMAIWLSIWAVVLGCLTLIGFATMTRWII